MTEAEYKKHIYAKAETVRTKVELEKLIDEITQFKHDYGTVIYGAMAAMIAAFHVVNRSENGGITGFQAGCLGWECVHKFMSVEPPCRLLDYNNMLYPQYEKKFQKFLSPDTWDDIKKKAEKNILEADKTVHPDILEHWKFIAAGQVPFGYTVAEI